MNTETLNPGRGEARATTTGQATYFSHRGRRVRLFKRSQGAAAAWYLQRIRRGKRTVRSLETPIKAAAVAKAKTLLDAWEAGNMAAARLLLARPTDKELATIGQVIDWAECAQLIASEITRRNYIGCLRTILRRGLDVTDPDVLSTASLTAETVRAFYREAAARAAVQDQEHAGRILRTANSTANQAGCLFTPRMRGDMKDAGLALPDLSAFIEELKARSFRKVGRTDWRTPDDAVLECTLSKWRGIDMGSVEGRNTYIAFWLMLSCGLRAGEVPQVHWDWIKQYGGATWLDGTGRVKDMSGVLRVQPLEPFWGEGLARLRTFNAQHSTLNAQGRMIVGHETERADYVFRRISALLRDCGWKTQKTNHALRAWAGAVAVRERGIYGASQFLRHKSVTVTERHYSYMLKGNAQHSTFNAQ